MSAYLFIVTALSAAWIGWRFWCTVVPASILPGIPLVEFEGDNSRERYTRDAARLLGIGYDKHIKHDQPFCIRDFLNPNRPRVYLPVKYMEEVKNATQDELSLPAILNNTSTMGKVGGPRITDEIQISARLNLNRALNKLIEPMQTLCFHAAEQQLPDHPEWTSVVLYPKILDLFCCMSARVMVGPKLCDVWTTISMKYITRVLTAQGAIRKKYHPFLYWMAYYLNPEVALVNDARREAAELVRPILEERQAAYAVDGVAPEGHDDFIQWIMENYRVSGKVATPDDVVQNIFIVMFASLHGTSFIALQTLFSLLSTPGAVAEIREEITRVQQTELQSLPSWNRRALGELRIMDSFMKETLRLKPFQEATVQRVAMRSYSFKDGLKVPAGTVLSFPNLRYNTDPDNWAADATTFNGKRWLHRRAGFDASKYQFASTAENAFDWGAGLHACPGRFMADITIKLILISLVTNYDMKLPEGSPERPVESRRFTDMTPDTSTPVLIRSVKR